jgi:hypothetical protein
VYALVAPDGAITGYKVRCREEDDAGVHRNRAKLFSARKLGSLDRAREDAFAYRQAAVEIVERGEVVARPDRAGNLTVGDLFKEWITDHAAPNLSEGYATEAIRWWEVLDNLEEAAGGLEAQMREVEAGGPQPNQPMPLGWWLASRPCLLSRWTTVGPRPASATQRSSVISRMNRTRSKSALAAASSFANS